jgi:hypothetical protein
MIFQQITGLALTNRTCMPGLVLSLVGHLRHKPYFKMATDSMSIFFEGG